MPTGFPTNKTGKVYALVDPRTEQVRYVGRTTQTLEKRLKEHLYFSITRNQISYKANWIRELNSMGLIPIVLLLEDEIEDCDLAARERHWVAYYGELTDLTNLTAGGEGQIRLSEDGRRNLSEALKGRVFTEEHKAKLKAARSNGNWKLSEEARQALIERNRARKLSPEHKEALNSSRRGKKNTPEHNAKIAASKLGKPLSEEHKKKLSEARKRYLSQKTDEQRKEGD